MQNLTDHLTIANADELRHVSGVLEADQAAWRDQEGSLVLREPIKRAFPGVIWALEAIRLTLRSDRNP